MEAGRPDSARARWRCRARAAVGRAGGRSSPTTRCHLRRRCRWRSSRRICTHGHGGRPRPPSSVPTARRCRRLRRAATSSARRVWPMPAADDQVQPAAPGGHGAQRDAELFQLPFAADEDARLPGAAMRSAYHTLPRACRKEARASSVMLRVLCGARGRPIPRRPLNTGASRAHIASRCSGMRPLRLITGMKLVSPFHRGTRCQCRWSAKPAPAAAPRLRPTFMPSGLKVRCSSAMLRRSPHSAPRARGGLERRRGSAVWTRGASITCALAYG